MSSNTFSFRLSTTPGVSECFMGGWNKEKFAGPITWHDIAPDTEKKVFTYLQMENSRPPPPQPERLPQMLMCAPNSGSAIVNGEQVVGTTSTYILDTGSTLIIVRKFSNQVVLRADALTKAPRSAAMSFWASVPGSRALSGPQLGYYSFVGSELLSLCTLIFDSHFTLLSPVHLHPASPSPSRATPPAPTRSPPRTSR